MLEAAYGEGRALIGVARISAEIVAPGVIGRLDSETGLYVGDRDGRQDTEPAAGVRAMLNAAGAPAPGTDDARAELWRKMISWNGGGTVTAAARCDFGTIQRTPELRVLVGRLIEEALSVARASGAPVDEGLCGEGADGARPDAGGDPVLDGGGSGGGQGAGARSSDGGGGADGAGAWRGRADDRGHGGGAGALPQRVGTEAAAPGVSPVVAAPPAAACGAGRLWRRSPHAGRGEVGRPSPEAGRAPCAAGGRATRGAAPGAARQGRGARRAFAAAAGGLGSGPQAGGRGRRGPA